MKTLKNSLKAVLFLIVFFNFKSAIAQIEPKFDERIELTSIICRLAGYWEYSANNLTQYTANIDEYFAKYKNHPAILYAQKIRADLGISFDAIPSFAIRINQPPLLTPSDVMNDGGLDKRWNPTAVAEFSKHIQAFYKDTKCDAFFSNHQDFYSKATESARKLIKQVNFQWYNNFYGQKPKAKFNFILAYANGFSNYNVTIVHPDKTEELFAILGIYNQDAEGMPFLKQEDLFTLIHEFGHSYNNAIVNKYQNQLKAAGEIILPPTQDQLRQIGYNSVETMFIEGILRANVIQYFKANPTKDIVAEYLVAYEEGQGFIWMEDLVALIDTFNLKRNIYKTFDDFMPEVVKFFEKVAPKIQQYKNDFFVKLPQIINIENIPNQATGVDASIKSIKINFDKEITGACEYFKTDEENPFVGTLKIGNDKKSIIGDVSLVEKMFYSVNLNNFTIRSKKGYPLAEMYNYSFATKGYVQPKPDERFGYAVQDNMIEFKFTLPKNFDTKVSKVSVAGEFNNWNPASKGYELTLDNKGIYSLKIAKDKIGKTGETKMFKFVVNDNIWIEPKSSIAKNIIRSDNNMNLYLTIPN
ncbi:MAG: DUF4932 domain-containing protein [Microscillaceae bacterium]|jgi:hypothetical protein|nr:DUF4932 domain-containing protein [Microscillaceae bacterium]